MAQQIISRHSKKYSLRSPANKWFLTLLLIEWIVMLREMIKIFMGKYNCNEVGFQMFLREIDLLAFDGSSASSDSLILFF